MNIHKYEKQIKQHEHKALGHEETMSFNHGYVAALLTNNLISKKEYNALKKVYSWENTDGCFHIDENGKLKKDTENAE